MTVEKMRLCTYRPERVGVILTVRLADYSVWYCLGMDRVTGELTDFGGKLKKRETLLSGAFRELREEIGKKIGKTGVEVTPTSEVLLSRKMMIVFATALNIETRDDLVKSVRSFTPTREMKSIVWLPLQDLQSLISGRFAYYTPNGRPHILYEKVRLFLMGVEGRAAPLTPAI